jgi:Secretion system C-terminal sorting domain
MRSFILFILICTVHTLASAQQVWYVQPNALGNNTGTSWQDGFTDLHIALLQADAGDTILLKEGEYKPDFGVDRTRFFEMRSGVKLFGGFAGDESTVSQRHGLASVLNGNIGDLSDSTDNSHTLLALVNPDTNTLIDRVVFENAYAYTDSTAPAGSHLKNGGAVFIAATYGSAKPHFHQCTFRKNLAQLRGGAVYVFTEQPVEVYPVFTHCTFTSNWAYFQGGAVSASYKLNTAAHIEPFIDCRFDSNTANVSGGAVVAFVYDTLSFQFRKDTFIANTAITAYGGMFLINTDQSKSLELVMDSLIMHGNRGGIAAGFSLFTLKDDSLRTSIKMLNCSISGSKRSDFNTGNPVFFVWNVLPNLQKSILFENNRFFNDTIIGSSNYISGFSSPNNNPPDTLHLINNQFLNHYNRLVSPSNLLIARQNIFKTSPVFDAPNTILMGNVFGSLSNISTLGLLFSSSGQAQEHLTMHNNLLINHKYGFNIPITPPNIKYDIRNNIISSCFGPNNQKVVPLPFINGSPMPFKNNVFDIPCASLPSGLACVDGNKYVPDLFAQWITPSLNDFRLTSCSELIHAGSNGITALVDLDGNPRIVDSIVDIGPFEAPSINQNLQVISTSTCTNTGAIQAFAPNACGSLSYQWLLNNQIQGTGNTALQPGVYQMDVTDSLGRHIRFLETVPLASNFSASFLVQQNSSQSATDGSILTTGISGGTPPFQYIWSTGDTSNFINGLASGIYTITIVDQNGCQSQSVFQIGSSGTNGTEHDSLGGMIQPNPTSGSILLRYHLHQGSTQSSIRMYDITGRKVLERDLRVQETSELFSIGHLPTGQYFWILADDVGLVSCGKAVKTN